MGTRDLKWVLVCLLGEIAVQRAYCSIWLNTFKAWARSMFCFEDKKTVTISIQRGMTVWSPLSAVYWVGKAGRWWWTTEFVGRTCFSPPPPWSRSVISFLVRKLRE
ncbi:hypothetical protein HPP92_015159 [Vanilla planifolia]|uniref:Uncharacterized protein n=1 Tax=Vanilla planifolia TaxID=51239 RepID=A0A835QVX5_VANPL|nr:hypothetical protein HPP92_015159 [Vanilla planifolia]